MNHALHNTLNTGSARKDLVAAGMIRPESSNASDPGRPSIGSAVSGFSGS